MRRWAAKARARPRCVPISTFRRGSSFDRKRSDSLSDENRRAENAPDEATLRAMVDVLVPRRTLMRSLWKAIAELCPDGRCWQYAHRRPDEGRRTRSRDNWIAFCSSQQRTCQRGTAVWR